MLYFANVRARRLVLISSGFRGARTPPPPLGARLTPSLTVILAIMLKFENMVQLGIFKMIAASGFLTALECTKFIFGRSSSPDRTLGTYGAIPQTLKLV